MSAPWRQMGSCISLQEVSPVLPGYWCALEQVLRRRRFGSSTKGSSGCDASGGLAWQRICTSRSQRSVGIATSCPAQWKQPKRASRSSDVTTPQDTGSPSICINSRHSFAVTRSGICRVRDDSPRRLWNDRPTNCLRTLDRGTWSPTPESCRTLGRLRRQWRRLANPSVCPVRWIIPLLWSVQPKLSLGSSLRAASWPTLHRTRQ